MCKNKERAKREKRVVILQYHGIEWTIRDGTLFALDIRFSHEGKTQAIWLDLTHINMREWLGY